MEIHSLIQTVKERMGERVSERCFGGGGGRGGGEGGGGGGSDLMHSLQVVMFCSFVS